VVGRTRTQQQGGGHMAGKQTFVCFAAEDAFRSVPILAALDA
jgi:hypothetical protein